MNELIITLKIMIVCSNQMHAITFYCKKSLIILYFQLFHNPNKKILFYFKLHNTSYRSWALI